MGVGRRGGGGGRGREIRLGEGCVVYNALGAWGCGVGWEGIVVFGYFHSILSNAQCTVRQNTCDRPVSSCTL